MSGTADARPACQFPQLRDLPVPSPCSDVRVLVDFDGTIVPGDVTDHVMASFAGPKWLELEAEFQAGRMGARTCMSAQVDLIRATPADIARAVNERDADPNFPVFVAACRDRGIGVTVVSDGFDVAIKTMLQRYRLDLPFTANQLTWLGGDRWRLDFPNRSATCRTEAGNCKCNRLASAGQRTVVIGDGRSDFCVAARADFVLSKARLTEHCRAAGIRHWAIDGFADVMALFDGWIAEARGVPLRDARPATGKRRPPANINPLSPNGTALTG
jgi:2-hydroxy-3-keto-5-methylthiopentenyl-1-phosphate phosphatase